MATIVETARAKINLTLHLHARREDGFHLLESFVAFADVADLLTFEAAPLFDLSVTGPFAGAVATDDGNLVLRAARALCRGMGAVPPGAAIALEKNLPVAAGIGGGSADAAACIRGLLRLNRLKASDTALSQIAAGVGSDVNLCLGSRAAFATGTGSTAEAAPRLPPRVPVVLANPGIALPTGAVYEAFGLAPGEEAGSAAPPVARKSFRDPQTLADALRDGRNDLEEPALRMAEEIGLVKAALTDTPGCLLARMSGSGPTCFGLYATTAEAHDAAQAVQREHPGWWVRATTLR